jgi:AAA domain
MNLVKKRQLPETSGSEIDNGNRPKTLPLPPMVSARDLCANPPPTPPEIIEGILHQGGKMALGGGSKSFKTWNLLHLSICIPTGREWLGLPTTPSSAFSGTRAATESRMTIPHSIQRFWLKFQAIV